MWWLRRPSVYSVYSVCAVVLRLYYVFVYDLVSFCVGMVSLFTQAATGVSSFFHTTFFSFAASGVGFFLLPPFFPTSNAVSSFFSASRGGFFLVPSPFFAPPP